MSTVFNAPKRDEHIAALCKTHGLDENIRHAMRLAYQECLSVNSNVFLLSVALKNILRRLKASGSE